MSRLVVDIQKQLGDMQIEARFESDVGGITALHGRSGSGKTSIVNMIAGLAKPDKGRIALGEHVLFDSTKGIDLPPQSRRVGYVFQEDRLFPHMTVRRNLLYGATRATTSDSILNFDDVVEMLGVASLLDRQPHHLSGGEKQRVAIGRALLSGPEVVLMDEPLVNLDLERRGEILPFIEKLRDATGIPVIYVSHATEEVIRLADTVVMIADGKTVASGPLEEVMSRLDLRPLTGRYEAGAVLNVRVGNHDNDDSLSSLNFSGGTLLVPQVEAPAGHDLRVRVRARDVSIALTPPHGISILNVFPGRILEMAETGTAQMDVLIDIAASGSADPCPLWARITRRSAADLNLEPGLIVHALIKAVAIDRHSLGQ
ncbi:MAG: molybdenum ABC transporter ATP-binding protein [Alphaproteobacteria bacterium]|nr:molybdenum ABC transporter ATP-binding protein [Alphaproteobacteria bacterium]MBT4019391.1 molybdenum ABC transporter ATP-binding protein [Alphaproteobacteria bacterium]MBT7744545.1 molybdenum ABC transporter ATP-binding protein [Alphaproteobacteria bacterium]